MGMTRSLSCWADVRLKREQTIASSTLTEQPILLREERKPCLLEQGLVGSASFPVGVGVGADGFNFGYVGRGEVVLAGTGEDEGMVPIVGQKSIVDVSWLGDVGKGLNRFSAVIDKEAPSLVSAATLLGLIESVEIGPRHVEDNAFHM